MCVHVLSEFNGDSDDEEVEDGRTRFNDGSAPVRPVRRGFVEKCGCGDFVILFLVFVVPKPFGSFEKSCSQVGNGKKTEFAKRTSSKLSKARHSGTCCSKIWKTTPKPEEAKLLRQESKPELCLKRLQKHHGTSRPNQEGTRKKYGKHVVQA